MTGPRDTGDSDAVGGPGDTGDVVGGAGSPGPDVAAEVVYLDVDDEITSAAARMRRTEAERIAFVLPYGSRLATSRINFRLLAREAATRGKRLEIVAADASARALAGSAGLPVFASVAALEAGDAGVPGTDAAGGRAGLAAGAVAAAGATGEAPTSPDGTAMRVIAVPRAPEPIPTVGRRRTPIRNRNAAIAALVVLALIVAGALGAFLYLPSATIVLTPTAETLGPVQLVVQASTDVTAPDSTTLTVPARTFSFPAAATATFTTTGKKVTDTKATGSVTFSNFDTGGSNRIAAGSIVSTGTGVQFVTVADVTLPPATFDFFPPFSVHPSTTSVGVQAVVSGPTGNVGSNTITIVPKGENKNTTKVTNPDPTTGGAHDESPQISQQDVDAALAQLQTLLKNDLDVKVREAQGLPPGTLTFPDTENVGTPVPSVDPTTLVGQQVATFDLGLTTTGTVLGVDPAPVTSVSEQRLASQVGDGWQLQAGSTHIDVGQPSVANGVVSFPVTASATRTRIVDHDALVSAIKGLALAQARARLETFGQVHITLWPDWVTTIPGNADRISLTIAPPAPAPSPSP